MTILRPGRTFLWIAVLTANLLATMEGITLSWTSPVLPKLVTNNADNPFSRPATESEITWIGSLLSLGAIFGPIIAAVGSSKIGRKNTMLLLAIPYIVAFFILAFATSPGLYYFARIISGMSGGSVFTIVPTYLTEISEDSIRGAIGTSLNIYETSGILLSYAIGPYLSIMWFNLICALFPCVFIGVFMFMPETPQYLLSKGNEEAAKFSFDQLRGSRGNPKEFDEMKELQKSSEGSSFKDLYKDKASTKALIISVMLLVFQQLSGINVVLLYAQSIFEEADGLVPAEESSIILGVVMVISGILTPLIVDRYGRKILLIASAIGMLITEGSLGLYFYLDDTSNIGWLPVLSLVLYITAYGIGFGPLPWIIMAEVLPTRVKSSGAAVTAAACWILSFLLTKYFDAVSRHIGIFGSFWIFAACNALAIVFVLLYVPETKEKSHTEIQEMLKK